MAKMHRTTTRDTGEGFRSKVSDLMNVPEFSGRRRNRWGAVIKYETPEATHDKQSMKEHG